MRHSPWWLQEKLSPSFSNYMSSNGEQRKTNTFCFVTVEKEIQILYLAVSYLLKDYLARWRLKTHKRSKNFIWKTKFEYLILEQK